MQETLYEYCTRTSSRTLLSQWDTPANEPLTPQTVFRSSRVKVWWQCARGHRWETLLSTRTSEDYGCPYCAGRRPWPGETDLATVYPHLAKQWHPSRNGSLDPRDVLPGSHKKVWWLCEKGHEWEVVIRSRAAGSGCPVCANRVLGADNSLAAVSPELAKQWHPGRNGRLTPADILPGSERKVWWLCDRGHEWQARVFSRAGKGADCPFCTGRVILPGENDLETVFPDIAAQWHPEHNGSLGPRGLHPYSNRSVWWLCGKGHSYRSVVSDRTMQQRGCPYCAGRKVLPGFNDLATLSPRVAEQWHPTLNGALTPNMVTVGSHRKVWWQCLDGHVWKAVIYSRTGSRKCGCPVCAGNVRRRKT